MLRTAYFEPPFPRATNWVLWNHARTMDGGVRGLPM